MELVRPVFWTGTADIVAEYFIHNHPLQKISRQFPLYVVFSGRSDYLKQWYPNATLIPCENEWMSKAVRVAQTLKNRCDYDFVIRFCPDAVIKDVGWLLRRIKDGTQGLPDTAVGNQAEFRGITYIRGGCNATPRSIFSKLQLKPSDGDYDTWYTLAVQSAGGHIRNWPLFEINNKYTGQMPVWHPTQYDSGHRDLKVRLQTFLQEC